MAEFNGPQNERTLLANLNDVPNFNEDLQSWHAPIILNTAFIASGDLIFTLGFYTDPRVTLEAQILATEYPRSKQ